MSVKGIHWAQEVRGVGPMKKCLLLNLGERHHIDTGLCIVDQETLARDSEMAVRTVRKYLAELEAEGLIARKIVPSDLGRITHYELHFGVLRPQDVEGVRQTAPDPENGGGPANQEGVRQTAPDGSGNCVPDGSGTQAPDGSGNCVPVHIRKHEEHEEHELASQLALHDRVSKVLGPRGAGITGENISFVCAEWVRAGATAEEILRVVAQHTTGGDRRPIRSLRALTRHVEDAMRARPAGPPAGAPSAPPRPPRDLTRPEGRAGDCQDAIVGAHGMAAAEAWLAGAEWTEDEVLLRTEFERAQVEQRFGGVLRRHGFSAALLAS